MGANTDYLCNRIDELENEVATLDEKRNEYQVLSEDLEDEVEGLKVDCARLQKENEILRNKLRRAFDEIRALHGVLATLKANMVINDIMKDEGGNEE